MRRSRAPTLFDLPLEPSEAVGELKVHLSLFAFGERPSGQHHEVEPSAGRALAPSPKAFPKEPPGPVAQDRSPDPPTHGQAESIVAVRVLEGHEDEERPGQAHSLFEDPSELRAGPELQPWGERRLAAHRGSGSDALSALLPASLQHEATALGAHAHQEAVGLLPSTIVGLERPLHDRLASSPQSRPARQERSRAAQSSKDRESRDPVSTRGPSPPRFALSPPWCLC